MNAAPSSTWNAVGAAPCPAGNRHSRAGGNPYWLAARLNRYRSRLWIPACAGMTTQDGAAGRAVDHDWCGETGPC